MSAWFQKESPKVLIVEDDQHNHALFRDAFQEKGFEVIICGTADGDFIAEVVSFGPDIISMDLMIGRADRVVERDGFEAIELLKGDERTKDIPIMVVSNFFQDEKVERAKLLGVLDYFNVQGQTITNIATRFKEFIENPKEYQPSHPSF